MRRTVAPFIKIDQTHDHKYFKLNVHVVPTLSKITNIDIMGVSTS